MQRSCLSDEFVLVKTYNEKKMYEHKMGVRVFVPIESSVIPICCKFCSYLLVSAADSIAYRTNECCSHCNMRWVEPNLQKWKDGWRPSKEHVEEDAKFTKPARLSFEAFE